MEQAPLAPSAPLPAPADAIELRRLWQAPTFALGLLALIVVAIGRPYWRPATHDTTNRDLAEARAALEASRPDLNKALKLTNIVLQRSALNPEQNGLAHFIAGSAHLQRATQTNAANDWTKARHHLEQAETFGVAQADENILAYRLARAWFQTNGDPERIILCLVRAQQAGVGDPAETDAMLARSYLRLPQPDLASALDAVTKQLALPSLNETVLAPARLLRGELLWRLGQRSAARQALEYIKPQDPPEIYTRARWLRAMSCQEEGLYAEAQKLWEAILVDTAHPPPNLARVQYDLGICYLQLSRPADAARVWDLARQGSGEAARAAAFRLAHIRILNKDPSSAWPVLAHVLRDATATNYRETLVPLEQARQICEEACQAFTQAEEYDLARRLALAYEPLAVAGHAQELVGQVLDAWAAHLRQQAHGPAASRMLDEARVHDHDAGEAYERAAERLPTPAGQAAALERSADRFLNAGDFARAEALLNRYLKLDLPADRLAPGWFTLGLVYQATHQDKRAVDAYHRCIALAGTNRYAFRSRYQLGEAEMDKGHFSEAETILDENLHLMAFDPDPEAHEKTLLALAELLFKRGDYQVAAHHLRDALDQYPTNPRASQARLTLAACYRRLAARENEQLAKTGSLDREARSHYEQQYRHWLTMAMANYQKLKADLRSRQEQIALTDADAVLLRQAEFAEAECRFDLGQYEASLRLYDELAGRYAHQSPGLDALSQVTRCYWVQNQSDQALATLDRIRRMLHDMSDAELRSSVVAHTKQGWEDWLKAAEALCKTAPPTPTARR